MSEIDREIFGKFIQAQRKEKGYTQKELAQKLFISDKAVSKWERGLSLPDIQMLIPLAEILGVTVTELLEGKRIEGGDGMRANDVENLVKKALTLSGEVSGRDRKEILRHGMIFSACLAVAALEGLVLIKLGYTMKELTSNGLLLEETLGIIFGAYFWFGIKERLPSYYDENKISFYTDGIFEINMPGLNFNNGNWPVIVRTLRIWSMASITVTPLVILLTGLLFPGMRNSLAAGLATLLLFLGGMFIPIYVVGRDKKE